MTIALNNTSPYPNAQVYVMIIGNDPQAGSKSMSWYNAATGKFQLMQGADNNGIGTTAAYVPPSTWGVGSKTYCPYSFTVADQSDDHAAVDKQHAHVLFLRHPIYMNNVVDVNGNVMAAEPGNPTASDPNWFSPWDYMEFNWGNGGFNVDTSRVDAFNIPSNFVLQSATGATAQRGDLPA